jgi:hypothetical protein
VTVGGSDWNSNVIRACYPDGAALAAAGAHVVSCSGTVFAPYEAMLEYLRAMEEEILATAHLPECLAAGGRDQGFHNVMLYTGKLAARGLDVRLFENDDGPVQTLQFGTLYRDAMGRVLNARGEVAYIVHQWDRKQESGWRRAAMCSRAPRARARRRRPLFPPRRLLLLASRQAHRRHPVFHAAQ